MLAAAPTAGAGGPFSRPGATIVGAKRDGRRPLPPPGIYRRNVAAPRRRRPIRRRPPGGNPFLPGHGEVTGQFPPGVGNHQIPGTLGSPGATGISYRPNIEYVWRYCTHYEQLIYHYVVQVLRHYSPHCRHFEIYMIYV